MYIKMALMLSCWIILLCADVLARPVSYPGGMTASVNRERDHQSITWHYSPTSHYAIGLSVMNHEWLQDTTTYAIFNYLLYRNNHKHSQGNIYVKSGLGIESWRENFISIDGDWETRSVFVGAGLKHMSHDRTYMDKAYVLAGFAPYVGKYGDLHTWLMLKAQYNNQTNDVEWLPFIKMFRNSWLLKIGYSSNKDIYLGGILRF